MKPLCVVVVIALALGATLARAQCPAVGADTTCGVIITVTDAGATVSFTGQGPFDGDDDTMVGVINNSSRPIRSLRLSAPVDVTGNSIFAFDGDGVVTFGIAGNALDDTGYGGPNAYYTDISDDTTSGTVNFITPIPTGGGTSFFGLEAALGNCASFINNRLTGPTASGATIQATFSPNGVDLPGAATVCGFVDFNWQQTITNLPSPSPFFQVNNATPLVASPAFLDPPPGGYTYESTQGYPTGDQSYPFYYDPYSEVDNYETDTTLTFSDAPADPCLAGGNSTGVAGCNGQNAKAGSVLSFVTHLVGMTYNNGTGAIGAVDLGIGFTWHSNFNGTSGGVAVTKSNQNVDAGSGTGGVVVDSVSQITTYNNNSQVTVNGLNASANATQFVPVAPCRIMDSRASSFAAGFGPPFLAAGSTRVVTIPSSACDIPSTAEAYSLNVTAIPRTGSLIYLSIWPDGQSQPLVSTLNSWDGSILANAAIVPAGANGAIDLYVTNDADLVLDINGYFTAPAATTLQFYALKPCRVLDTRAGTGEFGGPSIAGGTSRSFVIPDSSCSVPTGAAAYSLNVTAVPHGPLPFITSWPTGQAQPHVSTLNSFDGTILANAAIVPAGTNGAVSFFAAGTTDLVVDINGYYAAPGKGGLNFYTLAPCRLVDTRGAISPLGGPTMSGGTSRTFPVGTSICGLPASAAAYSLNMTAVPQGVLPYLTLWPTGQPQPLVSTLNAFKGQVVANAATVPTGTNGSVDVYVAATDNVVIDINGYFGQ